MEAETLGDTGGYPQTVVDTLPDSLLDLEAETLGDTQSDAQALLETLADTLEEV